jgi:hypothetical protein
MRDGGSIKALFAASNRFAHVATQLPGRGVYLTGGLSSDGSAAGRADWVGLWCVLAG